MVTLDDIVSFIRDWSGYRKPIKEDDDLDRDIGIYGDDTSNFLEAYAEHLDVDMSGYLLYFHTGEEGQNFGALFFAPPDARVEHIAITPALLLRCARSGSWDVNYPEHEIPEKRLDIRINQAIAIVFLLSLIAGGVWKYFLR